MKRARFRGRLLVVAGLVSAAFVVLVGRLFFLQVVEGAEYRTLAERQYVSTSVLPYDRGDIYFTRKDGTLVSAATLAEGATIALVPGKVLDGEKTYQELTKVLPDLSRELFEQALTKRDDPYEELARAVPKEAAETIAGLDLPGVQVLRERWRTYPGGALASHALGFVGYAEDGVTKIGRYGLEKQYEDTLARRETTLYVNFFADVFARLGETFFSGGTHAKGHLVTTIEPSVQATLEEELARVQGEFSSKLVGGIVMDPKTGAIVAMAATPEFDPNAFGESETATYLNPLVQSTFEFGSTMKPLTMAAGIDAGVITPESTYVDTGSIRIDGRTISNFDGKARGKVPMQEILNNSLNTGVAHITTLLGHERFAEYFDALSFAEETGIDLPGEEHGRTAYAGSPRDVEYVTASFGQGIATTPIAMTRALASLANGGVLPQPHVGREIRKGSGMVEELGWGKEERVFSESAARTVSDMLTTVVDDALVGGAAKMDRYSIAAKTGTAQMSSPEGGYYDDRYLHSFFGYFPASDPRFIVFLFHTEPQGVRYASETLTQPFMRLAAYLIRYYDVPPDRGYEENP